ncbi:MAG: entericidin A/B family lipoprotein [Burkholderiaceae bacterium]
MTRIILIAIVPLFFLGACNTIAGIGEDISAGGKKVESAAKKNKTY